MSYIRREYRSLFSVMLLNFILFGISLTIIGATLPKIIGDFQWSYIATGIVLSAGSIGYFVSSFISGIFVQKFGPKRVIVTGLGLQFIGLMFFASRPIVLLNMLMNFLIGFGQGGTEVVVNFSVVRIERNGQSRLMNLMHAAFSVGAVVGPYAVIVLMKTGLGWQTIYRLMSLLSLIMAVMFLILPMSRLHSQKEREHDKTKAVTLLKHPLLVLSFLILLIYVGSELGVSNWISEYYVKMFNKSASVGALMVSIYWIGLMIGRLGISFGYRGYRPAEVALILAITCTVALSFAVMMKSPLPAGVGFFFAGVGYSAIYPLVMALVGKHFERNQGAAVGFAATGGGIGSFAFPFIMSAIADKFGIHKGFFFYVFLNILMIVLISMVIWQVRRIQEQKDQA